MRSTLSVLFYLKRDKQKKDGNTPINCRLTINGKSIQFSTKTEINPESWSVEANKAVGRSPDVQEVNAILEGIKASLHRIYHEFQEKMEDITPEKIKTIFLGTETNQHTLLQLFAKFNEDFKSMIGLSKSLSSYQKYVNTKQRLEQFIRDKYNLGDIPLKDINFLFVHDFDIYLRTVCKYPQNSTAKHIQRFKTIMILARNNEWIYTDPFAKYKVHFDKVDRGYLTWEELEAIMQKEFTVKRLEQVRDIFTFSCFTGLAYIDVKNLCKKHICISFDGNLWVLTKRQKTDIQSNIPLLDVAIKILEKYKDTLPDDKVLPVLSNQKMNAYLKEIGDLCGIDKNLTFHMSRHTFATTVTLTKGVPIETVSKMLGHTNIKTTQIYARVIDSKVSQDMNNLATKLNLQETKKNNRCKYSFKIKS